MNTEIRCQQCGRPISARAVHGLCPACLMRKGLEPESNPDSSDSANQPHHAPLPRVQEQFGGYRILAELGRGGMGAVYEAEQLESGRRVALKVLSRAFDSPDARKRFLREGRLAASLNHPNSVYVYGTEEINGAPAIAMELVPGGTLQNRVQREGPLPVGEAVDAMLQIISGLEAALAVGILHRDVKPSNCFVDPEGQVKVGDFGLSISTELRAETRLTVSGAFMGTPAFSSPEQLRGDELSVRSDIYSVGVTLYYVLTGHLPFEADNPVRLLATVLEKPAPTPAKHRASLPKTLCRVVRRCLEKEPSERFKNYAELRAALVPYSSASPTPATLALRFVAGAIDSMLIGLVGTTFLVHLVKDFPFGSAASSASGPSLYVPVVTLGTWLLYFALLEGLWGRSLGKAVCRLRVTGPNRQLPGVPRALLRAVVFEVPPMLPYWLYFGFDPAAYMWTVPGSVGMLVVYSYWPILALLFCTARRRNGFAGVHDLLSRTRVLQRTAVHARPVLSLGLEPPPATEALPRVGPYHVLESLGRADGSEWLLGYDTRLLRKVWIHQLPPGTPPLAPHLCRLSRASRLRWITGKRSSGENWDAYEGVSGQSLSSLVRQRQPWSAVRFWLLDLAEEMRAAIKDGSLPAELGLDRVWITADNRAKLLDFPAPGTPVEASAPTVAATLSHTHDVPPPLSGSPDAWAEARGFLRQVACSALEGRALSGPEAQIAPLPVPLPLHARSFLESLTGLPGAHEAVSALRPLLSKPASVTRKRRVGLATSCVAIPLVLWIITLVSATLMQRGAQAQPEIAKLGHLLQSYAVPNWAKSKIRSRPDERSMAIYVAARYGGVITNAAAWNTLYSRMAVTGPGRQFAEESVAKHPHPTEEETAQAAAAVKAFADRHEKAPDMFPPKVALLIVLALLVACVALPALIAALLFRGGLLLRAFGAVVTTAKGKPASRWRVFGRSLLAWGPALGAFVAVIALERLVDMGVSVPLLLALLLALLVWSLLQPDRGWPDRLAGTWLVPR